MKTSIVSCKHHALVIENPTQEMVYSGLNALCDLADDKQTLVYWLRSKLREVE